MARKPDPQWLDRMYNNRALVPDFGRHLALWAERSARVRERENCTLDLRYGVGPGAMLDVFPSPRANAPVLVFMHGGYWRSLDKADHSFLAPAFTRCGACVVVPNYALCPQTEGRPVGVTDITLQMVEALAWVWRHIRAYGGDPNRITVAGHSAGGHLAAMLLTCLWSSYASDLPPRLARNALSISGLYELESIRRSPSLQADLRLTPAQVRKASPAWLAPPGVGTLASVVGGDESAEFLRHNALIRSAWGAGAVPVCEVLPGLHHFSVLEALIQADSRLNAIARDLLGLA